MKKIIVVITTLTFLLNLNSKKTDWLIMLGILAAMNSHSECHTTITNTTIQYGNIQIIDNELEEINDKYFDGRCNIVPIYFNGKIIGHALVENNEISYINYLIYKKSYLIQPMSEFNKYIPTYIYALKFNN